MKKEKYLQEIKENLTSLNCSDFKKLWNNVFQEEKIDEVDKDGKDDLSELLLEEMVYFEKERLIKVHKFIEKRM